jgi:hypothetical protein
VGPTRVPKSLMRDSWLRIGLVLRNDAVSGIGFVLGRQRGNYDIVNTALTINQTITSA